MRGRTDPSHTPNGNCISDVWREYLSDEGIDLSQQLIIPSRNIDENDIAVLTDGNLTTCILLESFSSGGK